MVFLDGDKYDMVIGWVLMGGVKYDMVCGVRFCAGVKYGFKNYYSNAKLLLNQTMDMYQKDARLLISKIS